MKCVILKYNAGNIRSVTFALSRLGVEPIITDDVAEIISADRIIFPGVGEAGTAMTYLREHKLDQVIRDLKQPVLGICLGMQLLCKFSEESNTDCIGIFDKKVRRFPSADANGELFKVPQIGWNQITDVKGNLFEGIENDNYMYFVHGYYVELGEFTIAKTDYIIPYSSAIQTKNFSAVQFHPEKSAEAGAKLIGNFLK